jgi:dTDP-4-dehydrorhamnose reductase
MTKSNCVLFVGCGDLGVRTGLRLQAEGWQVAAMRRDLSRLPEGFAGYAGDYTVAGSLGFIADLRPDHIVATFNPTERTVEGYRRGFTVAAANLVAGLGSHRPRSIICVSSTRVFAEERGGWVDEDSALATADPSATAIIAAERIVLDCGHPASVVRFAGIYGKPGGRLLERIGRGQLSPAQPLRYSNRIHRDDCAGFLAHLLDLAATGTTLAPVYIGVDDLPAPQHEVESWLAGELSSGSGTESVDQQVNHSFAGHTSAGHTSAGHKRCRNRLLHTSGYQLSYPDYRSGYRAVLAEAH